MKKLFVHFIRMRSGVGIFVLENDDVNQSINQLRPACLCSSVKSRSKPSRVRSFFMMLDFWGLEKKPASFLKSISWNERERRGIFLVTLRKKTFTWWLGDPSSRWRAAVSPRRTAHDGRSRPVHTVRFRWSGRPHPTEDNKQLEGRKPQAYFVPSDSP